MVSVGFLTLEQSIVRVCNRLDRVETTLNHKFDVSLTQTGNALYILVCENGIRSWFAAYSQLRNRNGGTWAARHLFIVIWSGLAVFDLSHLGRWRGFF